MVRLPRLVTGLKLMARYSAGDRVRQTLAPGTMTSNTEQLRAELLELLQQSTDDDLIAAACCVLRGDSSEVARGVLTQD